VVLWDDPVEPDGHRVSAEVDDVAVLGVVGVEMGLLELQGETS